PDEFRGNFGVSIGASFGPPILDGDCTVLDPAELAQSRHKGARPRTEGRGIGAEKADCRQSCLLRFRRQRPCCRRAADQRDEIAPSHWLPPRGLNCTTLLLQLQQGLAAKGMKFLCSRRRDRITSYLNSLYHRPTIRCPPICPR